MWRVHNTALIYRDYCRRRRRSCVAGVAEVSCSDCIIAWRDAICTWSARLLLSQFLALLLVQKRPGTPVCVGEIGGDYTIAGDNANRHLVDTNNEKPSLHKCNCRYKSWMQLGL